MGRHVSIIGVPWDDQSSWCRGCAAGPAAIREAYQCDSTNTSCECGLELRDHPRVQDRGDLSLSDTTDPRQQIEDAVAAIVSEGDRVLVLGGDHALTWPVLRGVTRDREPVNVLHLDAHPDLYDELDGNRFSHATPMTRALEEGRIRRLVQVGIRTMNGPQQVQADRFGVEVVSMRDWRDDLSLEFDGPVYLTIDLDVLDPAFAPGVSHLEPGGLSTRQLISLIQRLDPDWVGGDIVELNPRRDRNGMTAAVAAKLMKEVLARMLDD